MTDFPAIISTAVAVATLFGIVLLWVFRAVVSKDVTPKLSELATNTLLLSQSFASYREAKEQERVETRAILADLNKIVQDIEARLRVVEESGPSPRITPRRRS